MSARASPSLVTLALLLLLVPTQPARAHAHFESSRPAPGSRVDSVPKRVVLNFTEPPTDEGVLKIRDGCKRGVIETARVSGKSLRAGIGFAQPGTWRVRYTVISKVDGHPTQGAFRFRVKGKRDCSARPAEDGSETTDVAPPEEDVVATPGGEAFGETGDPSGGGGDFPWIPAALGSAALIGIALLARRLSSR